MFEAQRTVWAFALALPKAEFDGGVFMSFCCEQRTNQHCKLRAHESSDPNATLPDLRKPSSTIQIWLTTFCRICDKRLSLRGHPFLGARPALLLEPREFV